MKWLTFASSKIQVAALLSYVKILIEPSDIIFIFNHHRAPSTVYRRSWSIKKNWTQSLRMKLGILKTTHNKISKTQTNLKKNFTKTPKDSPVTGMRSANCIKMERPNHRDVWLRFGVKGLDFDMVETSVSFRVV